MRQILLTVLVTVFMASSGVSLMVGEAGSPARQDASEAAARPHADTLLDGLSLDGLVEEQPHASAEPGAPQPLAGGPSLPVFFEEGQGAWMVRGVPVPTWVTPEGLVVADKDTLIEVGFVGAAPATIRGEAPRGSTSNYYEGDAAAWRTAVPHYDRVVLEGLYPGIDAVFYVQGDTIEFDLLVAPGADASLARLSVDGAEAALEGGRLVVTGEQTAFSLLPPVSFQDGAELESSYTAEGGTFGFAVAGAHGDSDLRIDPKVAYSTLLGGSSTDYLYGMTVTPDGDVVVVGVSYSGSQFPVTNTQWGNWPRYAYIASFDGGTLDLQWAAYVGSYSTYFMDVSSDDDSIAVTGYTSSSAYPLESPLYTKRSNDDVVVSQFSLDGQDLLFSTYLGSDGWDYGFAVDQHDGRIYVTGDAYGSSSYTNNFPTTAGAWNEVTGRQLAGQSGTDRDHFIAVLDPGTPSLDYSTYVGTSNYDWYAKDIKVHSDGTIYFVNTYFSSWASYFPPTQAAGGGAPYRSAPSSIDPYVLRLDPQGNGANDLVWATYVGGSSSDYGNSLAVDPNGVAYVGFSTYSCSWWWCGGANAVPTGITQWRTFEDYFDGVIVRLSPTADRISAGTHLNPLECKSDGTCSSYSTESADYMLGLDLMPDGDVVAAVRMQHGESYNEATYPGTQPWHQGGQAKDTYDYHVIRLNRDLDQARWVMPFGGSGSDYAALSGTASFVGDIVARPDGQFCVSGMTQSGDYPTTPGASQEDAIGGYDGFLFCTGILPAIPVITGKWSFQGEDLELDSKFTSDGSIHSWLDEPAPVGIAYTFTDIELDARNTLSGDDGRDPVTDYTYSWDLDGDGAFDDAFGVDGATVSHGIERGQESYCMRVVDTLGEKSEACLTFDFVNRPPTGSVDVVPDPPRLCETFAYDGRPVSDLDGFIVSYEWDYHRGQYGTDKMVVRPKDVDGEWMQTWDYEPVESVDFYRTSGTKQMALQVTDNEGATSEIVRTFSIDTNNGRPVARPDKYAVLQGQSVTVDVPAGVLKNDCHPFNLNLMNAQLIKKPDEGNLSKFENGGNFVYTAPIDFLGTDVFEYRVVDPSGRTSNPVTVQIDVLPRNTPPVANDTYIDVDEDETAVFELDVYDKTDDWDALAFEVGEPAQGRIIGSGPGLVYQPPSHFCTPGGPLSVPFTVRDPVGEVAAATLYLTVQCKPDAPFAVDDYYAVQMDAPTDALDPDPVGNDYDPDAPYAPSETFAVTGVMRLPGQGMNPAAQSQTDQGGYAELLADGTVEYTPPAGFYGIDTFGYFVEDSTGRGREGRVVVDVFDLANNDRPTAIDATVQVDEGLPTELALAATDPEDPLQVLSFAVDSPTALGAEVEVLEGNRILYTPLEDECKADDVITFHVFDPAYRAGKTQNTDSGLVTVELTCINDAPRPQDDFFDLTEDMQAGLAVLDNDEDPDTGRDSLRVVGLGTPTHGTVSYTKDGVWYVPGQDRTDDATFTYLVRDPQGLVSEATVTVSFTAVNDPPYTHDEPFEVVEDKLPYIQLDLLRHAVDPEGDAFAVTSVGAPQHGTLTLLAGEPQRVVRFTPGANATQTVTVPYTVMDARGANGTGLLTIEIIPVNDAPRVFDDPEGGRYVVRTPGSAAFAGATGILANDLDNEDPYWDLIPYLDRAPANGQVRLLDGGGFVYTPDMDFRGFDNFTYRVKDQGGLSSADAAVVELEVVWSQAHVAEQQVEGSSGLPAPERPVIRPDWEFTEGEEVELFAALHLGATSQAYWKQTGGPGVDFDQSAAGDLRFTAPLVGDQDEVVLRFEVVAIDGGYISAPQSVVVRIVNANDAPVVDAGASVQVLAGREVSLTATARDLDNDTLTFAWTQVSGPEAQLIDADAATVRLVAPDVRPGEVQSVWLGVTAHDGLERSKVDTVRVLVSGPTPLQLPDGFSVRPEEDAFVFDAAGVPDQEYLWDFGDGVTASGPEAVHRFKEAGQYEVVLTVRNADGLESQVRRQVLVDDADEAAPQAFVASSEGPEYLPVLVSVLVVVAAVVFGLGLAKYLRGRRRKPHFAVED